MSEVTASVGEEQIGCEEHRGQGCNGRGEKCRLRKARGLVVLLGASVYSLAIRYLRNSLLQKVIVNLCS